MSLIAHTPPSKRSDMVPHTYADHIAEALQYGKPLLKYMLNYSTFPSDYQEALVETGVAAIMLHDMGKLDEANQVILRGDACDKLPIDHIEAGVKTAEIMGNELLGWLIRGHHAPGLPSIDDEEEFSWAFETESGEPLIPMSLRGRRFNRDAVADKQACEKHQKAILHTNRNYEEYKLKQISTCGEWPCTKLQLPESGLTTRLMLSCLVNADHLSAASYSEQEEMPNFVAPSLRWRERLIKLNLYVLELAKCKGNNKKIRNELRAEFYKGCYEGPLYDGRLVMCTAPVGLGKTTSIMAYLLRKAIKSNSSRIFVIAPFSNIIDQTVKTFREAIVLDDENKEQTVVAHHHRAEFSDKGMRQYATSWQAPIVVTTAVQFFETLASANPTKLKKLNAVAGSAIFIDESHACLPPEMLPVAWHWLKRLADDWQCNIVFSSGSMVEFWRDKYLGGNEEQILPDLFPKALMQPAKAAEKSRVEFRRIEMPMAVNEIVDCVLAQELWQELVGQQWPSALIILNTVQSAAVVAYELSATLGGSLFNAIELSERVVLHISTALAPYDREKVINEVISRQNNPKWRYKRWYLVATSCVEAGIDLDFSIGFRESCSVTSYLQVAGRINRHDKRELGILFDFIIKAEGHLIEHPGFKNSIAVFNKLWPDLISGHKSLADMSTEAVRREFSIVTDDTVHGQLEQSLAEKLLNDEGQRNFQQVEQGFRVIKSDTVTVITNSEIAEQLRLGLFVPWQDIQLHSVQLWATKVEKHRLPPINNNQKDDVYDWCAKYEYDPEFLGIMAGLLKPQEFFSEHNGIL